MSQRKNHQALAEYYRALREGTAFQRCEGRVADSPFVRIVASGDETDLFDPRKANFSFFGGKNVLNTTGGWDSWQAPTNASLLLLICAGSGAGGAGGQSAGAGVLGGGGGGGGTGAITKSWVPVIALPKMLWVAAGAGGAGGAAASAGKQGVHSFIADQPFNGAPTFEGTLLQSGATAATAPGAPAGASSAGGTGETALSATANPWLGMQLFQSAAGTNGSAGGASGGAGVAVLWGQLGVPWTGGAGGGTTNTTTGQGAGGAQTGEDFMPTIAGGAVGGGAGTNGTSLWTPWGGTSGPTLFGQQMTSCGGSGGGAKASGTGGAGGNGGIASGGGGGGGGGGTSGGTGGVGGAGGPGFVIIISM